MTNNNKLAANLHSASEVINETNGAATALVDLFKTLANARDALNGLSMPNIPLRTMGGHVFWNELAKVKGWKLQKNMFTGHCRILDPDDVRRAWGGEEAMLKTLQKLVQRKNQRHEPARTGSKTSRSPLQHSRQRH